MLQSNFFFYLVVVVVILIVVGLIVLIHAGLFYKPRVRVVAHPVSQCLRVAYVAKTGPYKNVGSAFRKLGSLAPKTTLFGIYYDDTDKVPEEKLRSIVGCCLPDPLEATGSSNSLEDNLQKHGYQIHTFSSCDKAIVTEYPFKSLLSIFLAIYFVYHAVDKYVKDHNIKPGPCIEYYEKNLIHYVIPLDHHEQFYVPGFEPNQVS